MKHDKSLSFIGLALVVLAVSAIGMLAAPVSASTTTYTGPGTPRSILEHANNATSGSISTNNTGLTFGIPASSWSGYQMATTFTNIVRNADFTQNGRFSGSPNPPWYYSQTGNTGYIYGGFSATPPAGSNTGSDYISLQGIEIVKRPIANENFTSTLSPWNTSIYQNSTSSNYISPSITQVSTNGGALQEYASYSNYYYLNRTGSAVLAAGYNFTYGGSGLPDFASLNYRTYVSNWQMHSGGSMAVELILTRYAGGTQNFVIYNSPPISSTTSRPSFITSVNITQYLTTAGLYRVRLYAYIYLITPPSGGFSAASVNWDSVGVYIRYNHYSSPSQAMWRQTFPFNQYALAGGKVTFRYYTNLTTIVPSTNSYLTVWVNGTTNYNSSVLPFSSLTIGSWGTLSIPIPLSVINQSSSPLPTISLGIGVNIGTNLEINSTLNLHYCSFYFDNVTFFIQYKPTPGSIKLGIVDNYYNERWNDTGTTYGSGTLIITPTTYRAAPWPTSPILFYYVFSGTKGIAGYNATSTGFNYASTLYSCRWTETSTCTFTVHDDTTTTWYLSYLTPPYIGGCQNYNVSVYVPTDWLSGGLVTQIQFGGLNVTNYQTAQVNSSTWVIKIPASVFPDPPTYPLDISATSPNYLGPSTVRTLLYTQSNTTNTPSPSNPLNWKNATYFIQKNMTRLVGAVRNATGGIPANLGSFIISVTLYNASNLVQPYTGRSWSVTLDHNGMFNVTLNPWSKNNPNNVTYGLSSSATLWYFAVNCTNYYEVGNGIARFTTNQTVSTVISTTLISPNAPYSVPYGNGFTLTAQYRKASDNSNVSSATVKWYWSNQANTSSMAESPAYSGNYMVAISISAAQQHYGTYSINITATKGGFARQSILVQVIVRNVSTTGSAISFAVPYQKYAWNNTVQTSITYTDVDHNTGVTLANLYVNKTYANDTTVGASGIRWWYRYSGSGGTYSIFFNATTSTPTGTNPWSFNVTASKPYYQVVSFNLNGFYIQDRPTSYSTDSLTITTWWDHTTTFNVTYLDTDAGGTAIPGATATCNWTYGYTVEQLSNRTYEFILTVPATLSPQTILFTFSLSKSHFFSQSGISAQLTIRSIRTSLSSTSNTITMYWGNNQTALLIYKDLDNNINISSVSWIPVLVYNSQTGANYTLIFASLYNIYPNPLSGSWTIRVNGSLPIGTYTLWINASVPTTGGYYVSQLLSLPLAVNSIPTSLTQQSDSVLTVVWSDVGKAIISYTDTNHSRQVSGANVAVIIDSGVTWYAQNNGSGIYTVFFNTTGEEPRTWSFTIEVSETNYSTASLSGNLVINKISTSLIVPNEISLPYGSPLNFTVYYQDLNHMKGIYSTNSSVFIVSVQCNWTGEIPYDHDDGNGSYLFTLVSAANGGGSFEVQVDASAPPYYLPASQTFTIEIKDVATSLALHTTPAATPWGDNITVTLDYDLNGTSTWVAGATILTNWNLPYSYFLTARGQWQIELSTTNLPEGNYSVEVNATKQYYDSHTLIIPLSIRHRQMTLTIQKSPSSVSQGDIAPITIYLIDADNNSGVTRASIAVIGLANSSYSIKELSTPGYYEVDVKTGSLSTGKISFNISATKDHYNLPSGPVPVSFIVSSSGLSFPTVIMISGGSSGAVVLVILGYVMYRRRKIPFIIKKIDQSIRLINRGEVLEPVPMKTRTQMIDGIYQTKLAILSKEKIEEMGKNEKKGTKKPEATFEVETKRAQALAREEPSARGSTEAGGKVLEGQAGTQRGEADVALIAEELERLETKGGAEPIRETDLIKREMEELEREAKKKKKRSD